MRKSKWFAAMAAVSMVFAFGLTASAGPLGPMMFKMRPGLGGIEMLLKLNLTETQRTAMITIIDSYRDRMESVRDGMIEARDGLRTASHFEPFDEQSLRQAFREVSSAKEEMIVLRAKMRSEMKALLTPEQLQSMEALKQERLEKVRGRMRSRLGS